MTITLNGTTGITTDTGYSGDGVTFADGTPSNTLVTTTGGNVGVGTSSPSTKLSVVTASTNQGISVNDGTVNTILYNTSSANGSLGTTTNHPFAFYTNNSERMRIDSSGNLLVGTTVSGLSALQGFNINLASGGTYATVGHVSGTGSGQPWMAFSYNGSAIGSITQNGTTATSYNTTSDYRLKENVAPMTGALAKVQALKPCTYTWKSDGSDGQGFIAHELQAVVPDCVTGEKDAVDVEGNPVYQGIDTSFLVATLTAAIQELKAEFDEYKRTHP